MFEQSGEYVLVGHALFLFFGFVLIARERWRECKHRVIYTLARESRMYGSRGNLGLAPANESRADSDDDSLHV